MTSLNRNDFRDPPPAWRSVPFWSLNDDLAPGEIERQLIAFKKGGFGGSYLHSRIGLLTEYLGDDWWKAMDAGVKASEKLGIEAWFYDEDKWPSGFAGGIVPLASEDYHARYIVRLVKGDAVPPHGELLTEDERYQYYSCKAKMGNAWFNGTCWVDLMNPATVKAFIDSSYKPYAERYRSKIGKSVHGIFTDEPQISPRNECRNTGSLPYSPLTRDAFKAQHGYDFVGNIASLFDDVGDFASVRYDYFRTISRQFEMSFSKQIGDYCESTGLTWTGHFNGENSFRTVMLNVGNMMAHYRHMQRPGIDHLGLHISGVVFMMKSLSSVANQYGRDRRLSEMFGISGQNMNFEDRKWIADCHAVLGVNHICPHLSLYSMKGCRKRDYPPTISPQQPYWSFNKPVEDYMARTSYLSSVGTYAAEMLVLVPLESAYVDYANGTEPGKTGDERFNAFTRTLDTLLAHQRDYDLGDEEIISEKGMVKDDALQIGDMQYRAVMLPYLRTIRASTIAVLEKFAAEKGIILAAGALPDLVDGRKNDDMIRRLTAITRVLPENDVAAALAAAVPPRVNVVGTNKANVWVSRRLLPGGSMTMFFNRSRLENADVSVTLCDMENPVLWDPASGECFSLDVKDGSVRVTLAPAQSVFIATGSASKTKIAGRYCSASKGEIAAALSGVWRGKRLDPNAITLDFARYSISGASFSAAEPVLGIHERLTRQVYNGTLMLAFDVAVETTPKNCALVIEQPEMYTSITVNGSTVAFGKDIYRDISFRKTDVTKHMKSGTNTVELSLDYTPPKPTSRDARERYGSEIESIYLIGDFGVRANASAVPARSIRNERGDLPARPVHRFSSFSIVDEREEFDGDLAVSGYPFYAGAFELKRSFTLTPEKGRRYVLTFPDAEATVITAVVNGKKLPPTAWSPWEIDITSAVRAGENSMTLTLVNSLRNLLGPHHHIGGELIAVGPVSFTGRGGWPSLTDGDNDWFDVRKNGTTKIWTDDYHHIPFGLLTPSVIEMR
ncbi:MAG: glycosyl hydrolase [Spirochaetota bacterium]